jgi:glycosyltransferase involved in cell wall biosynthesis
MVPAVAKTALKDARDWRRGRAFEIDASGPWIESGVEIEFVWQRHELFHIAGARLAHELEVPLVLFVPAVLVWQARQWNVKRPGWERLVERHGELPPLHAASLVACGTDEVAEQVVRLGVNPALVLVTPTGADLGLFTPTADRASARTGLGIGEQYVIGWVGSFRPFHALEQLIAAAPAKPGTVLLFVGDGPERRRIEELAENAGLAAIFTGTVAHDDLPRHLAAMDVGVVLADPRSFHFSPLKVAEYLAAGVPVVAPDVAPLAARLEHERNAVLYPAGDVAALGDALGALGSDPERRSRLRAGALDSAPRWSWDEQIRRVRAEVTKL